MRPIVDAERRTIIGRARRRAINQLISAPKPRRITAFTGGEAAHPVRKPDIVEALATPVEPDNWAEDSPSFDEQAKGGGQVQDLTFTLPGGTGDEDEPPRAERRYHDYANDEYNYSTGVHQFSGTFTINSMGGDRISLKQTFNEDDGPYFMMAVERGGRLYNVKGGTTIADGVAQVGTPVQVHTVHDTSARVYRVYINGSLAYTATDVPEGQYYDKLGAYQTDNRSGDIP